jgi:Uma2 family endonuclease
MRIHLLRSTPDDGIVVLMTTDDYLHSYETNRPRELAYGIVREPAAPFVSHQLVVLKIARMLADYVESARLGYIGIAPLDVVLDAGRGLIVQPDVLFVSTGRTAIIRKQIWGAPDLVVEVSSPGSAAHDRTQKLDWYRQYGVRECWIADPGAEQIAVFVFDASTAHARTSDRTGAVHSAVLPGFTATVESLLLLS